MMDFLKVKNQSDTEISMYIYGDIIDNTDWKWDESDIMPDDVRNFLEQNKGKTINLFVNSGGGSVFSGLSILNMLKRFDGEVIAHIDGLAASIASVLIFGATKVRMPANSYLMIHRAWSFAQGNAEDMRKMADTLERIDEGILNTYKENLKDGVDIEEIKAMMDAETWMTGSDAAKYFNIELIEPLKAVACAGDSFKNYKNTPDELKEEEPKKQKITMSVNVDTKKLAEEIAEIAATKAAEQQKINDLLMQIDLI
jgi:ATP-dependent Clp endopeptidase proteolytic subunit ClpP